jgi:hypothetical protein
MSRRLVTATATVALAFIGTAAVPSIASASTLHTHGVSWTHVKPAGSAWTHVKPAGSAWTHVKPTGTSWT